MKRLIKLYSVCQATTSKVKLWVKWSRTSSAISKSSVKKQTNCSFMKKYIFASFYQFNDYIINQIENINLLCIVFVTDDQYESVAAATLLQGIAIFCSQFNVRYWSPDWITIIFVTLNQITVYICFNFTILYKLMYIQNNIGIFFCGTRYLVCILHNKIDWIVNITFWQKHTLTPIYFKNDNLIQQKSVNNLIML